MENVNYAKKLEALKTYPVPGALYLHYKGGIYEVLTLATHTERDEKLVIYQSRHFGSIHARPLDEWNRAVMDEQNEQIERFTLFEPPFVEPIEN